MAEVNPILPEQVKLLYGQLKLGAVASLINASILSLLLWEAVDPGELAAWYALVILVNVPRIQLGRYYKTAINRISSAVWLKWLLISNMASGAVWGVGAYFLFPADSIQHQLYLAFILAGMTAGAVPMYSALTSAYAAFMLPALLPFMLRILVSGPQSQLYMALLVLFFALVLLVSSRRINATIVENMQQRFSNQSLLVNLNTAHQQVADVNQKLRTKIEEVESAERHTRKANAILDAINQAQMRYLQNSELRDLFEELLGRLLELTDSEYGFIGQVLHKEDGQPYLKTYALTNISWDADTRDFYAGNAPQGLEFTNLKTLFGAVMTERSVVISNDPANDPRAGGLPPGHPPLHAFLGVPFMQAGEMVGMFGISNRPGGYDHSVVRELDPFLNTCTNLIQGERARSRQRETEAELTAIHSQIGEGIATLDIQGRFMSANPAVERMFGLAASELAGTALAELLNNDDAVAWRDFLESFSLGSDGAKSVDVRALRAGKSSEFPLEIMLNKVDLASGCRLIAVLRDVTERKKVERMKNEFVSTVSHELRTPLTSIRGSLGLLDGGAVDPGGEQGRKLIAMACSNSVRLGNLVNDLLDMEKIVSGGISYHCSNINVPQMLQAAVAANQSYASQFNVDMRLEETPSDLALWADAERVMQVLANLLSNAVKFSEAGSVVCLSAQPSGDSVRVEVRDHGRGIADDFVDKVFEKFTQADASDTRAVGGTGLGLSISKALIEGMHGTIGFSSVPGQGTTFFFELPAVRRLAH